MYTVIRSVLGSAPAALRRPVILALLVALCVLLALQASESVSAQEARQPTLFALLSSMPSEGKITTFTPGQIGGMQVADFVPVQLEPPIAPVDLEFAVTHDGQYVVEVSNALSQALIAYGPVGGPLTVIDSSREAEYVMGYSLSRDSRYLAYTLRTMEWTFGILELATGRKSEITGFSAGLMPDLDPQASFGKMIPVPVGWSADGKSVYVETFLLFGCRGPHALYELDIDTLLTFSQRESELPPTRRMIDAQENLFSYAFSSDGQRLAYATAVLDNQCTANPGKITVVDLATRAEKDIVKSPKGQSLMVIDWTLDDRNVLYALMPDLDGDMGPEFPLGEAHAAQYLRVGTADGKPTQLPDLRIEADQEIRAAYGGDKLLYFLSSPPRASGTTTVRLYARPYMGKPESAMQMGQGDSIRALRCGYTLFFVTASNEEGISTLYSYSENSAAAQFDALGPLALAESPDIRLLGCR